MASVEVRALHRRLVLNTISNVLRLPISIGIAFFLTPFIVHGLGDAIYGFWVLVMSFIGYAGILEMGVQPAVVKLVGQYRGTNEVTKLNELITAALVYFLGMGGIAAATCVTIVPYIVEHHVEGLESLESTKWVFPLIAVGIVLVFLNYVFSGVLYGWQCYHQRNVVTVLGLLINAALVVSFLERWGIMAIVLSRLVTNVFEVLSSFFLVRRVFPKLRLHLGLIDRRSFKELLGFGGQIFISSTTTKLATHAQPFIISTALTAAATTFYAIPVRLIQYAREITWALGASFMPAFSELQSRGEMGLLRSVYLRYSSYIFLVMIPLVSVLYVYGKPFIGLWIGPQYAERGGVVLYLLLGSVLVDSLQPLLWRLFIGVGRLNVLVWTSASMSLVTVLLGIALVIPLGIEGVALSVLIRALIAQSIFYVYTPRFLEISMRRLFMDVHARGLLIGLVMVGVLLVTVKIVGTSSYLAIVVGSGVAIFAYAFLVLRLVLSQRERQLLVDQIFKRVRIRRGSNAERGK